MPTIEKPTPALLPSLRRLWREAFGDGDAFLDDFMRTAFSPDRARCVTEAGEAVAALYWLDASIDGHRIAYLYAIATKQSHRGRGLCRLLMEDTHALLARAGYDGALLVPSEPSLFDFYARFGYAPCAPMRILTAAAAPSPYALSVRRITAEEYGVWRTRLLPRGGVVQDEVSLRFLETQYALYAGDGWITAARKEGRTLIATELLGDESLAPAIVAALGCTHGQFRVAGTHTPFAMIRPLTDKPLPSPTYFSLAFD